LEAAPLSVSALTGAIKGLLEAHPLLRSVLVQGEVSNLTRHASGHIYFSLKDEGATLSAVLFKQNHIMTGSPRFGNGDRVVVTGRISVYPPRGAYQLVADRVRPAGLGDLYAQFQALKERLEAEGLFDLDIKRPLPPMPHVAVLITSATGAVLHDIVNTLRRRYPCLRLYLIPAVVQGDRALPSLLAAFNRVPQLPDAKLVILARGGGSLEDLWCFNEEALARAIRACPVPVVSAIGHQTDFTIADFAADLRAPTPTAAAEIIAPDRNTLLADLHELSAQYQRLISGQVALRQQYLDDLQQRLAQALLDHVTDQAHTLDLLTERFQQGLHTRLQAERHTLDLLAGQLAAYDLQQTLERGFTLTTDATGARLRTVADAPPGAHLRTYFADGAVASTVDAAAT